MSKQRKNDRYQVEREEFQAYGGAFGYDYTHKSPKADPHADQSSGRAEAAKPARKRRSGFASFFLFLTIVTIGLIVVLQTVFRLEVVCVIGHERHSAQDVINLSGLKYGQNIFSINEADVRTAVERDASLVYGGLQVKYPNMVYLQIVEREPAAVLEWNGIYYLLDADGVVLDEINMNEYKGSLPLITGMRVRSATKGLTLEVNSNVQLNAYSVLIKELIKQDYVSQVREIQMSSPENLYIVNVENISIRIGPPEDLKRKVQAIRTAMGSLRSVNTRSGLMDVCNPEDVKYRADE